jgi:hypothetical protein
MYWHIEEIMKYTMLYSIADVRMALAECIQIGAYHKNSVRRLLSLRATTTLTNWVRSLRIMLLPLPS